MDWASRFLGKHPEPPAWLYGLLARGPLARRIYRLLVADLAAALPSGARLLDVGTGPGYLLRFLARERPDLSLLGLDLDHRMIRLARKGRPPAPAPAWLVGDALALSFPEKIFDQAIATFSLHIWPDPVTGLREMWRTLKPGGRAWVYELSLEAAPGDLKAFCREVSLPFLLLYPAFHVIGRKHAVPEQTFSALLQGTGAAGWRLTRKHHLFWRGELER